MSSIKTIDRRNNGRKDVLVTALVGPKRTAAGKCENATIENLSSRGTLIRSTRPLSERESVVLFVGEAMKKVYAKVMWVRPDGVATMRHTGKPGQAIIAGCRIKKHQHTTRRVLGRLPAAKLDEFWVNLVTGVVVAGALAFTGGIGYLAYRLYLLLPA